MSIISKIENWIQPEETDEIKFVGAFSVRGNENYLILWYKVKTNQIWLDSFHQYSQVVTWDDKTGARVTMEECDTVETRIIDLITLAE